MIELKECPFCGGEAEIEKNNHREYPATYNVRCKKRCIKLCHDERTLSDAVAKWNRRFKG